MIINGILSQPVCLLAGVPATSSDGDEIFSKNKAESCTAPGSSKTPGNRNRSSIDVCINPFSIDVCINHNGLSIDVGLNHYGLSIDVGFKLLIIIVYWRSAGAVRL